MNSKIAISIIILIFCQLFKALKENPYYEITALFKHYGCGITTLRRAQDDEEAIIVKENQSIGNRDECSESDAYATHNFVLSICTWLLSQSFLIQISLC